MQQSSGSGDGSGVCLAAAAAVTDRRLSQLHGQLKHQLLFATRRVLQLERKGLEGHLRLRMDGEGVRRGLRTV